MKVTSHRAGGSYLLKPPPNGVPQISILLSNMTMSCCFPTPPAEAGLAQKRDVGHPVPKKFGYGPPALSVWDIRSRESLIKSFWTKISTLFSVHRI